MKIRLVFAGTFLSLLKWTEGHGRLIEPPSRASAWRYGFDTPHNYNDHELYCGGFTRQWVKNEGKCGVCGDAWDSKKPRAHEYGGVYGQGVIVRKYGVGAIINIRVELTANHNGYFEFRICPGLKSTTQECLDQNILKLAKPQEGVDHRNYRFYPKEGNKIYEIKYRLPKKKCKHCVLQWKYIAGNNWGNCPNGTGAVGCGPQEEFRACSDIVISGRDTDDNMLPSIDTNISNEEEEIYDTNVISDVDEDEVVKPVEHYSPMTALIISLVSFLVVFLVLFLLYFHFYQVGSRFFNWFKNKTDKSENHMNRNLQTSYPFPPIVPPRLKKSQAPRHPTSP